MAASEISNISVTTFFKCKCSISQNINFKSLLSEIKFKIELTFHLKVASLVGLPLRIQLIKSAGLVRKKTREQAWDVRGAAWFSLDFIS